MRIAVISDTHDRVPPALPELIREADEIWHLGDVCNESVFDEIRVIGPPVVIVRGNCDYCSEWPLVRDLERAGLRIRLVHIPPSWPVPEADLVLHGHTHVPRDEQMRRTRFLNPGCVSRPNRGAPPSFAWLELAEGTPPKWSIRRLPHSSFP